MMRDLIKASLVVSFLLVLWITFYQYFKEKCGPDAVAVRSFGTLQVVCVKKEARK